MSDKRNEPMDPSVREAKVGTPRPNNQRICYAVETLVSEVHDLFPETPVEYSNLDGRNTNLDVAFDLTVLDAHESSMLIALLDLVETDARVAAVVSEDAQVLVSMRSDPRTQDSRAVFGLADAFDVLEGEEPDFDEAGTWTGFWLDDAEGSS